MREKLFDEHDAEEEKTELLENVTDTELSHGKNFAVIPAKSKPLH